ncbi:MAG: RusA family crossover junction endodeoxyribonuclease [Burkholderiales bacterium]|nr:RusA family crossover junction endodeoxyribonuclease [Burkholderiales bacterium]
MSAPLSTISLVLDVPPSLNNAFLNVAGRGRILSPRYRAWQADAHRSVIAQHVGPRLVAPPYTVTLSMPVKLRGDLDNRIKGVLDLMKKAGVMTDDADVVEIVARKNCATPRKCAVQVSTAR